MVRLFMSAIVVSAFAFGLAGCGSRQPQGGTAQDKKPESVRQKKIPKIDTDFRLAYVEGDHGGKIHQFFIKDPKKIAVLLQWHSEIMEARPEFSTAGMPCKPEIIVSLFKSPDVADDPEHFREAFTEIRDDMMLIYEGINCVDERKVTQEDLARLYEILGLK
jgi:hypothetical protein